MKMLIMFIDRLVFVIETRRVSLEARTDFFISIYLNRQRNKCCKTQPMGVVRGFPEESASSTMFFRFLPVIEATFHQRLP
jgi:hypothetical protein